MSLQDNLPIELWSSVCTMAADKRPRIFEAYAFQDLPIEKLTLKKPNLVTKSVFYIPELKDSVRTAPFVNLTPTKGQWLRVCFDVDPDHVSTLTDDKGIPQCFKLIFDVDGEQEMFMNDLDKKLRELFAPKEGVDWFPLLLERAEHASSFGLKVSTRNTCIKIHDGTKLIEGKGWDFIKDFPFQNAKAKVAFAPARVWEKMGRQEWHLKRQCLYSRQANFAQRWKIALVSKIFDQILACVRTDESYISNLCK